MTDLKERLHQIACCEGECRENRIEAADRITELEKLNQSEMDSNHRLIARNLELETQLDAVRGLTRYEVDDDRYPHIDGDWVMWDELDALLGDDK